MLCIWIWWFSVGNIWFWKELLFACCVYFMCVWQCAFDILSKNSPWNISCCCHPEFVFGSGQIDNHFFFYSVFLHGNNFVNLVNLYQSSHVCKTVNIYSSRQNSWQIRKQTKGHSFSKYKITLRKVFMWMQSSRSLVSLLRFNHLIRKHFLFK